MVEIDDAASAGAKKLAGYAMNIYNTITSERLSRLYIMAAITFFGIKILDKPMRSSMYVTERNLKDISNDISKIQNDVREMRSYGISVTVD